MRDKDLSHFLEYKKQLEQAVYDLDPGPIMAAADILFEAWNTRHSVWIFGNGGSWSTAEHFACDLRKWARMPGSRGVMAHSLALGPLVTAYANDHHYSEIFTRQLNDVMRAQDVLVGISCGGKSQNVISGLQMADVWNSKTIALTGHRQRMTDFADVVIDIQAPDIRVQEDLHLAVCHILAGEVRMRIAELAEAVPA